MVNPAILGSFLSAFLGQAAFYTHLALALTGDADLAQQALGAALRKLYGDQPVFPKKSAFRIAFTRELVRACERVGHRAWPDEPSDAVLPDGDVTDAYDALPENWRCAIAARVFGAGNLRSAAAWGQVEPSSLQKALANLSERADGEELSRVLRRYFSIARETDLDVGGLVAAFKREAQSVRPPRRWIRKTIRALALTALAALLIGAFWLIAILMEG